jgi:transposase
VPKTPGSGRRSKLTAEVHDKIVTAVRAGNYAEVAAQYAGISERTYYNWIAKGEQDADGPYLQFMQAIRAAEGEAEAVAMITIRKAWGDDWKAAAWYLERKFQAKWGRHDRIDHAGPDGGALQTEVHHHYHDRADET